jgi:quercetin dioxygenase-like cupin family protein
MELLKKFELGKVSTSEKDKDVTKLFDGARRQLIEVNLSNSAILSKHKSAEPITVFCLAGNGKFHAGENFENEIELSAGVLLTLDADIEHEVIAVPELKILVTKFKQN